MRITVVLSLAFFFCGCRATRPIAETREDCPIMVRVMTGDADGTERSATSAREAATLLGLTVRFSAAPWIDRIDENAIAKMFPGEFVILLVDKIIADDRELLARGGPCFAIVSTDADASAWRQVLEKVLK